MDLELKGKVAIVTGASKGIGKAVAVALAGEGCRVAICARDRESLGMAEKEIRNQGGDVLSASVDMTRPEEIKRFIDLTADRFKTVHILVNNVGSVGNQAGFETLSDADWLMLFELNVMSAVRITKLCLPFMKQQRWGRIINIASESGVQPDDFMPHYNATKACLINLTKSLSKAYGRDNILVNSVSPAFIRTPLVEEMMSERAKMKGITMDDAISQFLRENRPNIVLGRPGTSEETASVVVFLASGKASFVTGSNYRVDGGSVASA
jgi:3-oxoacyl-[acyl-carrier protein] reductase